MIMKYLTKIHQIKSILDKAMVLPTKVDTTLLSFIPKNMSRYLLSYFALFLLFFSLNTQAQVPTMPTNPNQLEIIKADSLVGMNLPFMQIRKLMGNVGLRQGTTLIWRF
jgi:hypothetical protein